MLKIKISHRVFVSYHTLDQFKINCLGSIKKKKKKCLGFESTSHFYINENNFLCIVSKRELPAELMVTENSFVIQVLPVGKELLACLTAFRELGSCNEGRSALAAISFRIQSTNQELESDRGHERDENYDLFSEFEWRRCPPLLSCWKKLLRLVDIKDDLSTNVIEAVDALCWGALHFCRDGKR